MVERPHALHQVEQPADVIELLRFRMVLSGKESDDLSASAVGQVAACGEPFQQVGEAEFTVCAGSASAQDLDGVVAFLRCGASKGVQQHQGSLALPQSPPISLP